MHEKLNYRNQIITAVIIFLLFFIVTRIISLPQEALLWVTDMVWTVSSGFVAWACWKVSKSPSGKNKQAWRFFAYAHLSWFIGMLIWDGLELFLKSVTPFPAVSDFFFISFAVLFNIALVKMRVGSSGLSSAVIQISKMGILISSIVIAHIFIFSDLVAKSSENTLYTAVVLAYPVFYISALSYALISYWQTSVTDQRHVLVFIVSSLLLHSVATDIYFYSLMGKSYAVGGYIDFIWMFAFLLMYFSVQQQKIENQIKKNIPVVENKIIQHRIDVLITPVAMLILLAMGFVYSDQINEDNATLIIVFTALLIVFFIIKEIATDKYQESLKTKVEKSEETFKMITDTGPGVVYQFCMNEKGEQYFPYVSDKINDLLGLDAQDVMDDASVWISRIHGDDLFYFADTVRTSFETLKPWKWEGRMLLSNGSAGWFRGESIPVKKNDIVTWTGIIMDISENKKTEIELQQHREHLQELVDERTTELVLARDDAERANVAKSEFLSRMSHELRTPLNAILGFGQMLEMDDEDLSDIQQGNVQEILEAGKYLLNLITDILDLAKIESGKSHVFMQDIDVSDVLQQSLNLIKHLAETRQLEIIDNVSDKGYTAYADSIRLKQVLVNLLTNAVKYNRVKGRIVIDSEVLGHQTLRISISDTGKGLSKEAISKLFIPFERLDTVNNVEGAGIGLVITKRLVENMGGSVGVDSEAGKGSTFWIQLTLSQSD